MLNPVSRYLMIAKLVAILALVAWGLRINDLRARWHRQYESEHAARAADRLSYQLAQIAAADANRIQVEHVKAEQQRITTNAEQSYEADLARLRAELGKRLSQGGTAAPKGAAGNAGSSDLPNATPVADDPSRVSIPTGLYVHGAELELQLERLQRWVADQLKVDPNK